MLLIRLCIIKKVLYLFVTICFCEASVLKTFHSHLFPTQVSAKLEDFCGSPDLSLFLQNCNRFCNYFSY